MSMEKKWNIFVIDDHIYFARSWTGHCFFKAHFSREETLITLRKALVAADKNQYNYADIEQAKVLLLGIIQLKLNRDDLYVDPAFELDLIKQTLASHQPTGRYRRSIGRQSVRINKAIYQSIQHVGKDYVQNTGGLGFMKKSKIWSMKKTF